MITKSSEARKQKMRLAQQKRRKKLKDEGMKAILLHVPPDIKGTIRTLSEGRGVNYSEWVQYVIDEHLKRLNEVKVEDTQFIMEVLYYLNLYYPDHYSQVNHDTERQISSIIDKVDCEKVD